MRNGNTSMPLLLVGIAVLLIAAIFLVSRQNTTVAPEREVPTSVPSQPANTGDQPTTNNGVMEGEHNGEVMIAIDVTINNYTFAPETLTIKKGTAVTWKNEDAVKHTVTALDNSFDSGLIGNDQTFSHTFDTPGTYNYYCKPHPQMKGTIVVTE